MDPKPSSITLYRGWLDKGKHVWSPFVIKVEARLRFAGVPYATDVGSTRSGPKGKIPYLTRQNASTGEIDTLSDSTLIIASLRDRGVVPDLNARLSAQEKALDMGLRAMLEDKLYFYHTWERWVLNYYAMRDHALWSVPWPMRVFVGQMVYRKQLATLDGQGTGRLDAEEIAAFRAGIWEAVNDLLLQSKAKSRGDAPFWVLGGEKPTEADGTLFGFTVSVMICTACPASQRLVQGYPVVLEYAKRIHDTYFPDYEKWI